MSIEAGIGVSLVRDSDGCLNVVALADGGAAQRSNLVYIGDRLRQIDGVEVGPLPQAAFRSMVMGKAGSQVTLSFQAPSKPGHLTHVTLTRAPVFSHQQHIPANQKDLIFFTDAPVLPAVVGGENNINSANNNNFHISSSDTDFYNNIDFYNNSNIEAFNKAPTMTNGLLGSYGVQQQLPHNPQQWSDIHPEAMGAGGVVTSSAGGNNMWNPHQQLGAAGIHPPMSPEISDFDTLHDAGGGGHYYEDYLNQSYGSYDETSAGEHGLMYTGSLNPAAGGYQQQQQQFHPGMAPGQQMMMQQQQQQHPYQQQQHQQQPFPFGGRGGRGRGMRPHPHHPHHQNPMMMQQQQQMMPYGGGGGGGAPGPSMIGNGGGFFPQRPNPMMMMNQQQQQHHPSPSSPERAGVGIVFTNELAIKKLASGSPASRCRIIHVGDVLQQIDGRSVRGRTVADIQPLISGPMGSQIHMSFRRKGESGLIHVHLHRVWVPSANDLKAQIGGLSEDTPVQISRITDTLFLACSVIARNRNVLVQNGVGAVINCAQECANHHQDTFRYLHFMLDDHGSENIATVFREAAEFIDENARQGVCTLVHCAAGRSRSATIVIAYMMISRGMSLSQAAQHVLRSRPWIKPNTGFLRSLLQFERTLRGHRSINPEALEAMFARRR